MCACVRVWGYGTVFHVFMSPSEEVHPEHGRAGGRVAVEGRSIILKSAAAVDQSIVVPWPVGTMFTSRRYNRAAGPSGETCTMRKGQEKHINRLLKCGGWWDVRWFRVRSAGGTFPTTKRPALTAGRAHANKETGRPERSLEDRCSM